MQQRVWEEKCKAGLEEADGDAEYIAKALDDIVRAKDMGQLQRMPVRFAKVSTRHSPVSGAPISTPSLKS